MKVVLPIEYMDFMMNVSCCLTLLGRRRYNVRMWKLFTDLFNTMPVAALIDDKILCMHGGLSPDLAGYNQINDIIKPQEVPDNGNNRQIY